MDAVIKEILHRGTKGTRLVLRPLHASDAEAMFEYASNALTCQYLRWGPHTKIEQTKEFIAEALRSYGYPRDILWGIELKETRTLIGVVRIYNIDFERHAVEVSYVLNQNHTGKGYMTEALAMTIAVCFDKLATAKVCAFFVQGNIASENVMKRCGMKKSSDVPHMALIKGRKMSLIKYEIVKGDPSCD